ncbi:MAG TPA: serine hydroxymethyltransferase [Sedimentisphaerales bacterium]|nr:serine hydroxymethyltransferase [Sedimentisphaerales bacterium]
MLGLLSEKACCRDYHEGLLGLLADADSEVHDLILKEHQRLHETLQLGAAENRCSRAVLAALGSVIQNKTAEGFPGARFHGGCTVIDDVEKLAVVRAKKAFKAQYANVQPHSGTTANQIVISAVLDKGDKILSMALDQGGHYSHGSSNSFTGKFFNAESYYLDSKSFLLDYDFIRQRALEVRPKLIICGASVYPRTIDFAKFREIADEVGALLLADISHISGLVIAGAHPSPIDHAHFTTTSTYKSGGPRGGLILMGKEWHRKISVDGSEAELWQHIEHMTFPGMQGTPYLNNIAGKAVFFKETLSDEYRARQFKIVENAKSLADNLSGMGYDVVTGGTDNHMILINVVNFKEGLSGTAAQRCLEDCGIVVDRARLPYDAMPPELASGVRLGTHIVTRNGMGLKEMDSISELFNGVLKRVEVRGDVGYYLEESFREDKKRQVRDLCQKFPIH